MAWFKQTEQKSPASPQSQAPAPPAASAPAMPVERQAAPAAPPAQPYQPSGAQIPHAEAAGASSASRVSRGLVLRGEITGREDISIDGEVEGTLRLEGARVTICPAGRVRANISAREIVVQGEVRGELRAEERIEIGRSGSVQGSAAAKRIAIEDGAVFNGSIEVLRPGEVARAAESAGTSRAGVARAAKLAAGNSPAPAAEKAADTAWRDEPVIVRDPLR
jgi:cytoskeletal protein CcmA (bactofilin family)